MIARARKPKNWNARSLLIKAIQRLSAINFLLIYRLQKTGYRLQKTGYRLQKTGYRLQKTGYRLQKTGYL